MTRLSDKGRGAENLIIKLVNSVRDFECEKSFAELKNYLQCYIKMFGKKYKIPGCDADEIEQECLFALRYKAIEDFNPTRGKFRSFAILCIKRHLFSLIKSNNQQKRAVLNHSLSLDEDRSEDGENLSLICLVTQDDETAVEHLAKEETDYLREIHLLSKLSTLEQEVYKLYMKQLRYDEIVAELNKIFPDRKMNKKAVDNALVRLKTKAHNLPDKHLG